MSTMHLWMPPFFPPLTGSTSVLKPYSHLPSLKSSRMWFHATLLLSVGSLVSFLYFACAKAHFQPRVSSRWESQFHGLCGFTVAQVRMIAETCLSSLLGPHDYSRSDAWVAAVPQRPPLLRGWWWWSHRIFVQPPTRLCAPQGSCQKTNPFNQRDEIEALRTTKVFECNWRVNVFRILPTCHLFKNSNRHSDTNSLPKDVRDLSSNPRHRLVAHPTALYLFGVLTFTKSGPFLRIPNETMQQLARFTICISIVTGLTNVYLSPFASPHPLIKPPFPPPLHFSPILAILGLSNGDAQPLVRLLESFFRLRSIPAVRYSNENALRMALEAFWLTSTAALPT